MYRVDNGIRKAISPRWVLALVNPRSTFVVLAGGLIDSNYGGRLAISISTGLAPLGRPGA
jgi:hypothetical protein